MEVSDRSIEDTGIGHDQAVGCAGHDLEGGVGNPMHDLLAVGNRGQDVLTANDDQRRGGDATKLVV